VLAGVYAPEEFDAPVIEGTVTEPDAADAPTAPEAPVESTPVAANMERDAINAAVPLSEKRPTARAWLEQLAAMLEACSTREQVEAVLLSDEALKAARILRGAAQARLRELRTAALARHPNAVAH
jgi:hypothetical protein